MAMILRNQDTRSEVQSKVASELQERLNQTQPVDHKEVDPAFLDDQHTTRNAGPLIVILLIILLVAIIYGATKL
jgi:hypothetical protein